MYALTHNSGHDEVVAGPPATSGTLQAGPQTTAAGSPPPPVDTPSPAEDRGEIVSVLHGYEAAYSDHDLEGLRVVMTPGITRHGLRSGGCSETSGRSAVLSTYSEQFSLGTGAYTLHGLSRNAVSLDASHASIALTYSIGGGGSGSVRFDLRRYQGSWRISRIDASC